MLLPCPAGGDGEFEVFALRAFEEFEGLEGFNYLTGTGWHSSAPSVSLTSSVLWKKVCLFDILWQSFFTILQYHILS
jgi:hypothetical protein